MRRLSVVLVFLLAAACSKSNTPNPTTASSTAPTSSTSSGGATSSSEPGGAASPGSSGSTSGSSHCRTADLAGGLTNENGAAGSTYATLVLKNTSSATCTMSGYPGVSLVDASGNQLGQPATRDAVRPVAVVTLSHAQSAFAQVRFPNPGNFQPGKCTAESANMRVYPPGETQSLLIQTKHAYCPGFSVSALTSQPN